MHRPLQYLRVSAFLVLLWSACGRDSSPKEPPKNAPEQLEADSSSPFDLQSIKQGKASEVTRSLNNPHTAVFQALGAHQFTGSSTISIGSSQTTLENVESKTELKIDKGGQYFASLTNQKGYGRDVYFIKDTLYLRPGVGRYHKRLPNSKQEPVDIREQVFSDLTGYFEIFAPDVEFSASGEAVTAKRPVVVLAIAKKPTPTKRNKPLPPEKSWRNTISVTKIAGTVHIDKSSGVPLAVQFTGEATFKRGGQDLTMQVSYDHQLSNIGKEELLSLPKDAKVVSSELEASQISLRQERIDKLSNSNKKQPN